MRNYAVKTAIGDLHVGDYFTDALCLDGECKIQGMRVKVSIDVRRLSDGTIKAERRPLFLKVGVTKPSAKKSDIVANIGEAHRRRAIRIAEEAAKRIIAERAFAFFREIAGGIGRLHAAQVGLKPKISG